MTEVQVTDTAAIAEAAFYIWQDEGQPHGRDQEFWLRAEAALSAPKPKARRAAAKTAAAPKKAAAPKVRKAEPAAKPAPKAKAAPKAKPAANTGEKPAAKAAKAPAKSRAKAAPKA